MKLVLLYKGQGKQTDAPFSYRPINLLDGAGKLLERLLLRRLGKVAENALSNWQFGFKRGKSTMDAIVEVIKMARAANSGPVQSMDLCTVVTLDIKNAFNSAPWCLIDESLQRSSTPTYLVNILRSYMNNRSVLIGIKDPSTSPIVPVTCSVPKGQFWYQICGTCSTMEYCVYLPVPKNSKLLAFADDVALVALTYNADLLEELVNPILEPFVSWTSKNGLALAPEKSECGILTGKKPHVLRQRMSDTR